MIMRSMAFAHRFNLNICIYTLSFVLYNLIFPITCWLILDQLSNNIKTKKKTVIFFFFFFYSAIVRCKYVPKNQKQSLEQNTH